MANTLSVYNPTFYANEALLQLEKALGMAGRVYRGYEKAPSDLGDNVTIRVPSVFSASSAPSSAQDIVATSHTISLTSWYEVKFKVIDDEMAYAGNRLVDEHIRPAAYALADQIDQDLAALYKYVPWIATASSPANVSDITGAYQILFDNNVPMSPEFLHLMVDGTIQNELQQLQAFSQYQGSGDAGVATQLRGSLGQRFGFEVFANQNVQSHTKGTLSPSATLQLNADVALNATSMVFKDSGGTLTGTVAAGDSFVVAGSSQRYAITAAATASGNLITVSISPKCAAALSASAAVTLDQTTVSDECLAFHRNAFALCMAPLPENARQLGAQVSTVSYNGLSLRARVYYVGNSSETHVALDVLYGVSCIQPNMAMRLRNV